MQCPSCFKEFKNYNSLRVHGWRFHNSNTKYKIDTSTPNENESSDEFDGYLALPVMATGIAALAGGNWKRWLIIIIILVAVGIVAWYLLSKSSEDENKNGP